MWTWPSTPMTSADRPMTIRPLASGFSGCRIRRTAMAPSSIGTSRSSRPKAPVTSISTRSPTGPRRLDQVPAATTSARPSSSSARPSLRCAGSSPFAPRPMPRNMAPTACASPSQRARASRYTPPVGDGAGFGAAGLLGGGLLGRRLLRGRGLLRGGLLRGRRLLRGAGRTAGARLRGARRALGPLPDVREAMVVRLPVRRQADTCAHCFTRSCRPARRRRS